jgi:excisionase family DNA binding protein
MDHPASDVHDVAPPTVGALYTTEEVAKVLRVSQRTVQVWIRSGTLTAVRYGRLLRIRQADLATFGEVLRRRPPPLSPPAPSSCTIPCHHLAEKKCLVVNVEL